MTDEFVLPADSHLEAHRVMTEVDYPARNEDRCGTCALDWDRHLRSAADRDETRPLFIDCALLLMDEPFTPSQGMRTRAGFYPYLHSLHSRFP